MASTVLRSACSGAACVVITRRAKSASGVSATGVWRTASIETSCDAEHARDLARARRAVRDLEPDLVAGARGGRGQHRQLGVARTRRALAAEHAVAGHRDDVAEHGRRGGLAAGAAAVEHELARGLGLDEHRVVRAADGGERVARGTRAGCTRTCTPSTPSAVAALGDREQLEHVARALRPQRRRRR